MRCVCVCVWLTKSAQRSGKLIFGGRYASMGEVQKSQNSVVTLTLTCKMRSKCGGHEISIGYISRAFLITESKCLVF